MVKTKAMTSDDVSELLSRMQALTDDLDEALTSIDRNMPDMEVLDGQISLCAWMAITANKFLMRMQSMQRAYIQEREIEELLAKGKAGDAGH